jgi:hypothetical protein
MIAADKKSIERALKTEHRTSQRQALLKQLWRLNQRAGGAEPVGSNTATDTPRRDLNNPS